MMRMNVLFAPLAFSLWSRVVLYKTRLENAEQETTGPLTSNVIANPFASCSVVFLVLIFIYDSRLLHSHTERVGCTTLGVMYQAY
jgi:hypothetical protein